MRKVQIRATEESLGELNFDPADEAQEIAQNISVLMGTPKGSVPLDRGMGMAMQYKDQSPRVAQMMFEAELADAIDKYESRADFSTSEATIEEDGTMTVVAEVNINGG